MARLCRSTQRGLRVSTCRSVSRPPDRGRLARPLRFEPLEPRTLLTGGLLDTTFGSGGKALIAFSGAVKDSVPVAVAVQSDGKILVAGTVAATPNTDFALARLNPNGSPDAGFGTGGKVTLDFFGSGDEARALAIQGDGKIVVVGGAYRSTTDWDFAVARFNTNGSLDDGGTNDANPNDRFGTNGKVTLNFGGPSASGDDAYGVAIQQDGKIVVVGVSTYGGGFGRNFAVARYNAEGGLDPGFGTGGKLTTDFGYGDDAAQDVAIQTDGKIVVVGTAVRAGTGLDFALARYNTNGSLDDGTPSDATQGDQFGPFGAAPLISGLVTTAVGSAGDQAWGVALQPDDAIVVAGYSFRPSNQYDAALARYTTGGGLDTTFGSSGVTLTPIGLQDDFFRDVAIQPNGKIVAAGYSYQGSTNGDDFALARYNPGGTLDGTFSGGGVVTTPIGPSTDDAYGIALQADGKILVAGYSNQPGTGNQFALARYLGENVAPIVNAGPDAAIDEGGTFTSSGSFTDPDSASWTATVNYGDGSSPQSLTLNADKTFSLSHTYAENGSYLVTVTVTDNSNAPGSDTAAVAVANVAPTVEAGPNGGIAEGGTFSSSGSFTDPGADTWTATVDYGDGSGPQSLALNAGKTFSLSHVYAVAGGYTVAVTVTDDDGGTGADSLTVTVGNVAPAVSVGPDATMDEGGTFAASGLFTDPGGDTWTATVDYGAGSGPQSLALNADKTFSLSHTYGDDGIYTAEVTVADGNGGVGSDTLTVTVNNVAPIVVPLADVTIEDGATFQCSGSFVDPGADSWTAAADYGDGSGPQALAVVGHSFTLDHVYAAVGMYTVTVWVSDGDGGVGTGTAVVRILAPNNPPVPNAGGPYSVPEGTVLTLDGSGSHDPDAGDSIVLYEWDLDYDGATFNADQTGVQPVVSFPDEVPARAIALRVTDSHGDWAIATTTLAVTNAPPEITSLSSTASEVGGTAEGQEVAISGTFTDPGVLDVHAVTINWGDGTATSGAVSGSAGAGSFSGAHAYAAGGLYTITVTLADDDGGAASAATSAAITGAGLHDGVLEVVGVEGDDRIVVGPHGQDLILVRGEFLPGSGHYRTFPRAGVQRIVISTGAGNDLVMIPNSITAEVIVDGGSGGGDILIGGQTSYDPGDTVLSDSAYSGLLSVLAEWNSGQPYETRIAEILALPGFSVTDDQAVDVLIGGSGRDWYFADLSGSDADALLGLRFNETVVPL